MTILPCPPMESDGRLVSPLLEQVDCQVAYYVETTYGSLFGPFGFLGPVLTGALTLYIAFYGYQLIIGRGALTLSGLAPKVLLIGLVLAFATNWGAYQGVFLNLFYGGADELASVMTTGGVGNASVFARLDTVLQEIIRIAEEWNNGAINGAAAAPSVNDIQNSQGLETPLPRSAGAVNLLWFSAILLALSTVGILVIAKVLLGLLLAVGPVLVVLALFSATRGLFEGWLKTLALYMLVAAFATVLAGGILQLIEPMVRGIANARAGGDASPQPVFVLAVTAFVFTLLMLQVLRMCGRLTAGWRLPTASDEPLNSDAALEQNTQRDSRSNTNGRVADMVVAVERSGAGANDARARSTASAVHLTPPNGGVPSSYLSRRNTQRYAGFTNRLGARGRFA